MAGPWYEYEGPTVKYVRDDVKKYITNTLNYKINTPQKKSILDDAILKILPDDRNDFGSWRGYATFGVKTNIAVRVLLEYDHNWSYFILETKFIPFVLKKLYNPENGRMVKKISKTTLVGKANKKK